MRLGVIYQVILGAFRGTGAYRLGWNSERKILESVGKLHYNYMSTEVVFSI